MLTLNMKDHGKDNKELLAEIFPVIITILGLIVVLVFYFFLD
ncbi:MAG: hypothetical protein ABI543_07590 [Ignavibacteria bacterium]